MTNLPRSWLIATAIGIFVLAFFVSFGFVRQWGADQWGPLAEWLAGTATLAAVIVALRESFRAQRESMRGQLARLVDHEVSRRRECINALGDLWAALVGLNMDFLSFTNEMDDLPATFLLTKPVGELQPPGRVFGDKIVEDIQAFFAKWSDEVEPPLFVALALLHGTAMYGALEQVNNGINWIKNDGMKAITTSVREGQRPDTAPLTARWHDILRRRDEHLTLARQHFSLTRHDVETSVRREWTR